MDSGQDLINAMREQRKLLIECVHVMKSTGRKLAEAENKYRKALRKEILRLRIEDEVAWTACDTLARGEDEVAKLRLERDIRQSDYDVIIEKIHSVKLEIRLLEGEIKQEWGASG